MQFYLTKEQETILDIPYFISLQEKENELKELRKKTGKIQKYTAKAYILKEPRIFIIEDGFKFLYLLNKKVLCEYNPDETYETIYKTDSNFDKKVKEFIEKHKNVKITFYVDKKDGSMGYYTKDPNEIPAKIEALYSNEFLNIEDPEKYELLWS